MPLRREYTTGEQPARVRRTLGGDEPVDQKEARPIGGIDARLEEVRRDREAPPAAATRRSAPAQDHSTSAHAVAVTAGERFPTASLSVDDVLELRELTALSEELRDLAERPGISTVVLRPAPLSAYCHAVAHFVESREQADWLREQDREPLARLRGLLEPLEDLAADVMRAALSPRAPRSC
jgi:hypothetical protein